MRLADLLAGLSRLADVGFGLQPGQALRSCALACAMARSLDLPEEDAQAAYYTALLHHIGCTGYAHETAALFRDELTLNTAAARTNAADARDLFTTFLPALTRGQPPLQRARLTVSALTRGNTFGREFTTAACEVGRTAARRLHLSDGVQRGLYHVYELWKGGGQPSGLTGGDIPVASRLARLTGVAVLFDSMGGTTRAVEAIRRRGGGMLDPQLAAHFVDHAEVLLDEVNAADPRAVVLASEPRPVVWVEDARLTEVAAVFGDLADLKSPYLHGHSRAVAELARGAGQRLHLPPAEIADLEVAGSLHDLGRVAVSARIWDKPGALSGDEWESVRLHAYHSERMLAASESLARLAPLVGMHHERLDGRGYHRECRGAEISTPARVLAAADAYAAMTQDRPHRVALTADAATARLLAEVRSGALDPDAAEAVLAASGRVALSVRRGLPAGLTDREVEVLRLVAQGHSNKEIADQLVISRRTAEHHVQHIYTKIGVSSRAAAALFAMEHHLLARRNG